MATRTFSTGKPNQALDLVYEVEGSGPPLVFLPGAFCSAVQWERLVPYFMSDFTCFALEPRGHGRSAHSPNGDYRWATFLSDTTGFLTEVVAAPAIMVGHSFGGAVSMGVAASRPELVRAIYAEDVVPANVAGQVDAPALLATLTVTARLLAESKSRQWSVAQFTAAMIKAFPAWAELDPYRIAGQARMWFGTDPAFGEAAVRGENASDEAGTLAIEAAIRCPLHIAQADSKFGGIVTDSHLQHLRDNGVNFTTTAFPGADHGITVTQLKPFLSDLRTFLARIAVN